MFTVSFLTYLDSGDKDDLWFGWFPGSILKTNYKNKIEKSHNVF